MATIQNTRIRHFSDTSATLSALKSEHAEFEKKVVFLNREAAWWQREYAATRSSDAFASMNAAMEKFRMAEDICTVMWDIMCEANETYCTSKRTKYE